MCIYHIFISQPPVEGLLDCFYSLAIVHRTAMNIAEQVSVGWDVGSYGQMSKSGVDGPYDRFNVWFFRVLLTDFD